MRTVRKRASVLRPWPHRATFRRERSASTRNHRNVKERARNYLRIIKACGPRRRPEASRDLIRHHADCDPDFRRDDEMLLIFASAFSCYAPQSTLRPRIIAVLA